MRPSLGLIVKNISNFFIYLKYLQVSKYVGQMYVSPLVLKLITGLFVLQELLMGSKDADAGRDTMD